MCVAMRQNSWSLLLSLPLSLIYCSIGSLTAAFIVFDNGKYYCKITLHGQTSQNCSMAINSKIGASALELCEHGFLKSKGFQKSVIENASYLMLYSSLSSTAKQTLSLFFLNIFILSSIPSSSSYFSEYFKMRPSRKVVEKATGEHFMHSTTLKSYL